MSDMETGRRAGGNGPLFTTVVIAAIVLVLSLLAWRALSGSRFAMACCCTEGRNIGPRAVCKSWIWS